MTAAPFRIVTLYRFTRLGDVAGIRATLAELCRAGGVMGTLLLADEGINGTIAGADAAIEDVLAGIRSLPGCSDIAIKESWAAAMPFHRLKVRIKHEIVTMGQPTIDPARGAGRYVAPADWNALIARPETILIDTRNQYEVAIGSFAGAIDPGLSSFRDFPAWFRAHRDTLLAGDVPPKVAMFCTGGIRCEKATALLRAEGLDEVFHLEGGVLAYLEAVAPAESRWQGECFVFDERVAVAADLTPGSHVLCRGCRMPVTPADRASPLFEEGVSCPGCHADRSDDQRRRYAERQRQTGLAAARGAAHVGAVRSG